MYLGDGRIWVEVIESDSMRRHAFKLRSTPPVIGASVKLYCRVPGGGLRSAFSLMDLCVAQSVVCRLPFRHQKMVK